MADSGVFVHDIDAKRHRGHFDAAIAALAQRQHGVVSRKQLLALGMDRGAIAQRLKCGRLHRVHSGVYGVGHLVLSKEGRYMSAVLAAGPDALLVQRSAAAHWEIQRSQSARIDVAAPRRMRSRGLVIRHHTLYMPDEVTTHRGIPVTTVHRTLFDLASVVPRRQLERAMNEAEVRRLFDVLSLPDLLERHPRRPGNALIRAILADTGIDATVTRNDFERDMLDLVTRHNLPRPEVNALVEAGGCRFEVDFAWRAQRLAVEVDGFATHGTRQAFEEDRIRDRVLQAAGWRVVRITWRQLYQAPDLVASDLQALLFDQAA
jgi:very-short-patch-repair endonuclease